MLSSHKLKNIKFTFLWLPLDNLDSRFSIGLGSFIVGSLIAILLGVVSVGFHGLDIYTDVDFSVSLYNKYNLDQDEVKEQMVNCTQKVDEEFLQVVEAFQANGDRIYSDNDETLGLGLTEKIKSTADSYFNCFNTEDRFRDNHNEWLLSSVFSLVHICLPFITALIVWAVIIKKQEKIGTGKEFDKDGLPSCVWFSWNLPWLPVTKFYEVGLRIGLLFMEYEREESDDEDYKETRAELAAMVEQNENTGKDSLFRRQSILKQSQ